jgi:hypothetical protein
MSDWRFWSRLEHLERKSSLADRVPAHVERLIQSCTDPVVAEFYRERHDPHHVRQRLQQIRLKAEHVSLPEAADALEQLVLEAEHVERLAMRRDLSTGRKQNAVLDEHRRQANELKQGRAAHRQHLVAKIASETRMEKGALVKFVREQLETRYDLSVTKRTIERDLKKVRQTG